MRNSIWWVVIAVLFIIILVLAWFLFMTPVNNGTATGTVTGTSTGTAAGTATGTGTGTATGTATGTSGTTTQPTTPVVRSPVKDAVVAQTFTVAGEAPGNWFFEAVFPVKVLDGNGNVVATAQAHAQGDWMTTAMVPFTASITVAQYKGPATVVLSKDNPSGLPQNDASFSIPVTIQ